LNGESVREEATVNTDRHSAGFTVLEFVYASAILLVVAIGVMGAMSFSAESTARSSARIAATNLANQRIEQARNLPYDDVGVTYSDGSYGDPAGTIKTPEVVDSRFTVSTSVTWARGTDASNTAEYGRALYKKIKVTVTGDSLGTGAVAVSTSIYGKSSLVNVGDLSIMVKDHDTGAPLAGASVIVTPASGTAHVVTADANGEAFFGHLPTGDYQVTVTKTGYIFDANVLSAVTVAPDLLTTVVAYGYVPSTLTVHVKDDKGVAVPGAAVTLTDSGDNQIGAVTTDSLGDARFTGLLADDFTISTTMAGYSPGTQLFPVTNGGTDYTTTVVLVASLGLRVQVVDGSGAPLTGATVSLKYYSASTDVAGSPKTSTSDGLVSFGSVSSAWYTATAQLSGYTGSSVSFWGTGSDQLVQIILSANTAGTLTVSTQSKNYSFTVVSNPAGSYNSTFQTDKNGDASITLPAGTYTVSVTVKAKGKWTTYSKTVVVQVGGTSTVDFTW